MQKQTTLIAALILLSLPAWLCAQAPKNTTWLALGPGHVARQDLVFSPFVHQAVSPRCINLGYTRQAKLRQSWRLGFAAYQAAVADSYVYREDGADKQTYPHQFTLIDLDYGIGKSIGRGFSAGVQLQAGVQSLTYAYGRVSGNFGYFAHFGLGLSLEKQVAMGRRGSLSAELKLPLLNWLARSPYLVNDDPFIENTYSHKGVNTFFAFIADGHPASLDTWQSADLQLHYQYKLSKKWSVGAQYNLAWMHAKQPRNLLQFRNTLQCRLALHF
ncbi:MAG TPA: hypothetical protein VK168_13055 [Saprospiraceae bacterium]|nr:hypothetical protein [Saprospiraceae bacterium]